MAFHAKIFCKVTDNFGDAGICWRLAKQLCLQFGWSVNLYIDKPDLIQYFDPQHTKSPIKIIRWKDTLPTSGQSAQFRQEIMPGRASSYQHNVLNHSADHTEPFFPHHKKENNFIHDILISAFDSKIPIIQAASGKSLQIHIEYLSAEDWVDNFHQVSSTHPVYGTETYFFFPGFTQKTGGLLREADLLANQKQFFKKEFSWLSDKTSTNLQISYQNNPLPSLAQKQNLLISLFCYPEAPLEEFLSELCQGTPKVTLLIPEFIADAALQNHFGHTLRPGEHITRKSLTVHRLPFLSQDEYDKLLWSCDINFVRGEDSWVRAHWAMRPFVWQAYPQPDNIHLTKLDFFLNKIGSDIALNDLMRAWNGQKPIVPAWRQYLLHPKPTHIFVEWTKYLLSQSSFSEQLAKFCHLKKPRSD